MKKLYFGGTLLQALFFDISHSANCIEAKITPLGLILFCPSALTIFCPAMAITYVRKKSNKIIVVFSRNTKDLTK
jgi:hypothetical protein